MRMKMSQGLKKSLEEQKNIPSEERRIRCFDRWSKLDAKRNLLPSYRIVPSLPALFMSGEGTYIWNLRHHMSFYELLMIRVFIFRFVSHGWKVKIKEKRFAAAIFIIKQTPRLFCS